MHLALDPAFQPFPDLPLLTHETFIFAGGEPHLKLALPDTPPARVQISHRLCSSADVVLLLLAVDALRRAGVDRIDAFLPYFPGGRQDRPMVGGEPLSAKVYAQLINGADLNRMTIYDAHSDVTPALLDRCAALTNHRYVATIVRELPANLLLIAPDGGALKKVHHLAAALQDYPVITCEKSRDVRTGALSGFRVHAEQLYQQPCLIVDDICDGGGTFLGLAEALKAKGAGPLYLAVSHGIFSKGIEALAEAFDRVFATDAFRHTVQHPALTTIPLRSGITF